ncbi:peptide/nickel transport system permease protein [Pseudonocardia thermophila]|uniref:Peptide/nickel transport system permease protein n=1 Tax=Pseudonocardia thermophila TaxID=1848 RepID=A0A1M6Q3T0_PSETH|nr:ABC transporter permease [Pseudonocardia thermophila]SHK14796.1 peptide/nickel transport system permease protein [Pseudonocardia thermophila]
MPDALLDRAARSVPARAAALRTQPGLVVALLTLALVLGWALLPGVFASGDPLRADPAARLLPPGPGHWFGTDEVGRDLWTRVVHGTALSLQATLLAVGVGLLIGSIVGVIAGYAGGWADSLLMRLVDVLLAIPGLLLCLAVLAALGRGTVEIAVAVGIGSVPGFARVVRAEVVRIRTAPYVEAATASGVRTLRVLTSHVLPNAAGAVLAVAGLQIGTAVLAVSSLSFLGFGAVPPTPEWGSLVAAGRNYLATAWWISVLPTSVVVATVLAVNRVARAYARR